jgi:tetraacyldisaccharide 4'-kinase
LSGVAWDAESFRRLVRGESRGVVSAVARAGLSVLASGYNVGASVRNVAYDRGWKPAHRASVPVVSVGNLTLGGTGKTPMVEWISRWFRQRAVRVAVLSRGYGGAQGMNDEGLVLEENLPDVPHLQGPDRVMLARTAVEELTSEVLVLDDGFQHRRLARNVDLVLLDALDPFGGGRLFPRGFLREPVRSLRRADVVVLSRADLVDPEARTAIRSDAEKHADRDLEWVEARQAPRDLVDGAGESWPLSGLVHARVAAFCGIGNPEGFRRTVDSVGATIVAFRAFPDHYPYTRTDVSRLAAWVRESGADLALTTQKDLVKLRTSDLGQVPLRALRIEIEITEGAARLEAALDRLVTR